MRYTLEERIGKLPKYAQRLLTGAVLTTDAAEVMKEIRSLKRELAEMRKRTEPRPLPHVRVVQIPVDDSTRCVMEWDGFDIKRTSKLADLAQSYELTILPTELIWIADKRPNRVRFFQCIAVERQRR
jgi:hypothetical protein